VTLPIPTLVDGPLPRQPGLPYSDWWARVRRGERQFLLPTADVSADGEQRYAAEQVGRVESLNGVVTPAASPLREAILTAGKPRETVVPVPEWDVTLLVRALDGPRLVRWTALITVPLTPGMVGLEKIPTPERIIATAVVLGVFDPNTGRQVFTEADIDDVMGLDGRGGERIFRALDPPLSTDPRP
jgi:hypothetical protein